ncbi:MAG: response regulator [Candidatus Cryptobacteroides sp.]
MDIGPLRDIDCSGFTVMIVDDIPINSKLLAKLIEPAGFASVLQYNDSTLALENVKTVRPDIILLDIMMPGVDGFTFLEEVRKDPDLDRIKIVMVSAVSESVEIRRALSMGADDYITKPVKVSRLYSSLADQLGKLL